MTTDSLNTNLDAILLNSNDKEPIINSASFKLDEIQEVSDITDTSIPNISATIKSDDQHQPYHGVKRNSSINPKSNTFKKKHNSIKILFTDKFKTISNDFLRTFELAQNVADLSNSQFAMATTAAAAAAAAAFPSNENEDMKSRYPSVAQDLIDEETNLYQTRQTSFSNNCEQLMEHDTKLEKQQNLNDLSSSINTKPYESLSDTFDANHIITYQLNQKNLPKSENSKPIPDRIYISIWEVFIYLWGVIAFFIDLSSDIILSIGYYQNDKKWLCAMTLLIVIVPNLTLSLFSLTWYIDTFKRKRLLRQAEKFNNSKGKVTKSYEDESNDYHCFDLDTTCGKITFWLTLICRLLLQLDLLIKYFKGFLYTLKGWYYKKIGKTVWEKYYIEKQIKCDTDIGMLRLIDVFMDAGPQVLLQLYVITTQKFLNDDGTEIIFSWNDFLNAGNLLVLKQVISITSSLFSMGYALAGYHRCLRNQQFIFSLNTNKSLIKPISWWATITQFLWYLFLISPRVLSMALFASTFRSWFFMIIVIHWSIMYFWILSLKTNFCITSHNSYNAQEEVLEKFYNFVCSFIYIFVYFNVKSGTTRYRYLIYYLIFYLENIIFSLNYYFFSEEPNLFFKSLMLAIILSCFWIAIIFQVLYYLNCHPSHDFQVCFRNSNDKNIYLVYKHNKKRKIQDDYDYYQKRSFAKRNNELPKSISSQNLKQEKNLGINCSMKKISVDKIERAMEKSAKEEKSNEIINSKILLDKRYNKLTNIEYFDGISEASNECLSDKQNVAFLNGLFQQPDQFLEPKRIQSNKNNTLDNKCFRKENLNPIYVNYCLNNFISLNQ